MLKLVCAVIPTSVQGCLEKDFKHMRLILFLSSMANIVHYTYMYTCIWTSHLLEYMSLMDCILTYMGFVANKFSDQVIPKPACSATENS